MSERPSLLFLSPRFLFPADSGGKIRTRDVLAGMKGGAFRITLISPDSPQRDAFATELEQTCDRFLGWPAAPDSAVVRTLRRLTGLLSPLPLSVAVDRSRAASDVIAAELARDHNLMILDFPHAAVLAPPAAAAVPKVLFAHNVEAEIYQRHAAVSRFPLVHFWRQQYARMLAFERQVAESCVGVITVSERDRDFFADRFCIRDVAAIPTGVDLDFFRYRAADPAVPPTVEGRLVYVGSMDWRANIDAMTHFMDAVWPLIVAQHPAASLTVVGRAPPQDLVERARQRGLSWHFTGFVDDIRPYIDEAQVFIMPLRIGGGTRIKAYQAMAMGCPMVSTTLGVEGLPVEPDRHYLLADTPPAFANAVIRLLRDRGLCNCLATEAHRFVAANFSARRIAEVFETACLQAMDRTQMTGTPNRACT